MALAFTKLGTSIFSTANASPYTFAAVTPAANAGIVVCVLGSYTTGPITNSLDSPSWLNGSWTQEVDVNPGTLYRMTIFSGKTVASPGSDDLVASVSGSPTGCIIIVVQVTGQDATDFVLQPEGTNGSSATSCSATLNAALAGSDSAILGFFGHNTASDTVPSGGATELDDVTHASPVRQQNAQYEVNDTVSGASWTGSSIWWLGIMEIKAAAGGPVTALPDVGIVNLSGLVPKSTWLLPVTALGSLSPSGLTPQARHRQVVTSIGTINLSGLVPTIVISGGPVTALPSVGVINLSGLAPTTKWRSAYPFGLISLSGQAATARQKTVPSIGVLTTIQGLQPRIEWRAFPGIGTVTLSGPAPSLPFTPAQPTVGIVYLQGNSPNTATPQISTPSLDPLFRGRLSAPRNF